MVSNNTAARFAVRNILVAVDLCSYSDAVLWHAASIARRCRARLTLVHVVLPALWVAPESGAPPDLPDKDAHLKHIRKVEEHLAALRADENLQDLVCETLIQEENDVKSVLFETVVKSGFDLMVVGTHGYAGWNRVVLGSTAEAVIRKMPCPVITVGPNVVCQTDESSRQVICATTFSSSSLRALSYALTASVGARLTLLHVIAKRAGHDQRSLSQKLACERKLLDLLSGVRGMVDAEVAVEYGTPHEIIVRMAQSRQASLIVMGAHAARMASDLLTSTLHQVIRNACCPVLAAREG